MSLFLDIAIAAVSSFDPVTGFIMGTFKSAVEYGPAGVVLNLSTTVLPGGFVKDIGVSLALEAAATEAGATRAARIIAPSGSPAIRCQECGDIVTKYVGVNGTILCTSCAGKAIYQESIGAERLLIYNTNIKVYHNIVKSLTRGASVRNVQRRLYNDTDQNLTKVNINGGLDRTLYTNLVRRHGMSGHSDYIEVPCAVCGKHYIRVPARPGVYRVICPNNGELNFKWDYSATVIVINDDGSVKSYQGRPQ